MAAPQLANSANEKHVLIWIIWMTSCWEWRHMEGATAQAGALEHKFLAEGAFALCASADAVT